jgi:uncharacterized protein with PhoU and TrkA domain
MPLSFATILGGMVTLIGTPTNIVVAQFRGDATFKGEDMGAAYSMFDFAPVGLACAFAGLVFIALVGWRFTPVDPERSSSAKDMENLEGFVMEVQVPEGSKAIGKKVRDIYPSADENDVYILGLIRRGKRLPGTARSVEVRKGDTLVLEATPEALESFANAIKLTYSSSSKHSGPLIGALAMTECVVPKDSRMEGRSAHDVRLLYRQQTMLLGIARQGRSTRERIRRMPLQAGDVLLLMGPRDALPDVVHWLGCMPLADRDLTVTQRDKATVLHCHLCCCHYRLNPRLSLSACGACRLRGALCPAARHHAEPDLRRSRMACHRAAGFAHTHRRGNRCVGRHPAYRQRHRHAHRRLACLGRAAAADGGHHDPVGCTQQRRHGGGGGPGGHQHCRETGR